MQLLLDCPSFVRLAGWGAGSFLRGQWAVGSAKTVGWFKSTNKEGLLSALFCRGWRSRVGAQRVEQDVQRDAGRVFAGVAAALEGFVLLQRTADVVRREDDDEPAVNFDALQFRRDFLDS